MLHHLTGDGISGMRLQQLLTGIFEASTLTHIQYIQIHRYHTYVRVCILAYTYRGYIGIHTYRYTHTHRPVMTELAKDHVTLGGFVAGEMTQAWLLQYSVALHLMAFSWALHQ